MTKMLRNLAAGVAATVTVVTARPATAGERGATIAVRVDNRMGIPTEWLLEAQSDFEVILGRVLAHELGHHLLPGQGHSHDGIMQKQVDFRSDYRVGACAAESLVQKRSNSSKPLRDLRQCQPKERKKIALR